MKAGTYKVPYQTPRGGGGWSLSSLLVKNIKLYKGEGNIKAMGKNITGKKGKVEAIQSSLGY